MVPTSESQYLIQQLSKNNSDSSSMTILPNSGMMLPRSLSFNKRSVLASFCKKKSVDNEMKTNSKEQESASLQSSNSTKSVNWPDVCPSGITSLLEYDLQCKQVDKGRVIPSKDKSPNPSALTSRHGSVEEPLRASTSTGDLSQASSNTSFDKIQGLTVMKDSVIMLNRLGPNPTEDEMAQVAMVRTQESISDCISGNAASMINPCMFHEIPVYSKSDLLIGQHLGKGSFSDVFEVTVDRGVNSDTLASSNQKKSSQGYIGNRRPALPRRNSMSSAVCPRSLGMPELSASVVRQGKRLTLAMKCLRPQARSNFEHFLVGIEDLVHETAILSSLDHPNIIKLYGRAGDSSSFELSDGYFILIDRLQDTLQDKIDRWAKSYHSSSKNAPSLNQMKDACTLSGAISYLHANNIVFRDLKPANVGFNSSGTLKLFDFGMAISVASESSEESRILYDRCGTLRYMAPEVGLAQGYGIGADVYSFGILLWQICALKKPYSSVKSVEDFENKVFFRGERPKLGKYWPEYLKETVQDCWSADPSKRLTMKQVKSVLTGAVHMLESQSSQVRGGANLKKSFVGRRRLTLDI